MSEARLWSRMREGIKPFAFAQRIENLTGEGVPDLVLHSRVDGTCAFVELKCRDAQEMPKRVSTPIFAGQYGLRPEQVAWLHGRAEVGARVWILAQGGDWLLLMHGRYARDLARMTADDLLLAADGYWPARGTDWEEVVSAMGIRSSGNNDDLRAFHAPAQSQVHL